MRRRYNPEWHTPYAYTVEEYQEKLKRLKAYKQSLSE